MARAKSNDPNPQDGGVGSTSLDEFQNALDKLKSSNSPINSSGNSIQPLIRSLAKGSGSPDADPQSGLNDKKPETELSPDDPTYQTGLTAVFDAIAALPDCPHKTALFELNTAASHLPSGEVERLASTGSNKAEKWTGEIPKVLPEKFRKRPADEQIVDYLRRALGERGILNGQFSNAHLAVLDKPCADAVRNHVQRYGNLPADINLPIRSKSITD